MGLARLGKGEYHKVVLMKLGLVPAQAFRASRSEAAPTDPKTENRNW